MEGEKRQLQVRVMGACKRSARYAKKWAGATSEWCEMGHDTVLHARARKVFAIFGNFHWKVS